jgi:hypothetical protein
MEMIIPHILNLMERNQAKLGADTVTMEQINGDT